LLLTLGALEFAAIKAFGPALRALFGSALCPLFGLALGSLILPPFGTLFSKPLDTLLSLSFSPAFLSEVGTLLTLGLSFLFALITALAVLTPHFALVMFAATLRLGALLAASVLATALVVLAFTMMTVAAARFGGHRSGCNERGQSNAA